VGFAGPTDTTRPEADVGSLRKASRSNKNVRNGQSEGAKGRYDPPHGIVSEQATWSPRTPHVKRTFQK